MGCCSGNNKKYGNADIVKYSNEEQTKKKKWLGWIALFIILTLLIFSVLH